MRVLIIGNPIAGRGRAPRCAERLRRELVRAGVEADLYMTERAGDAAGRAAAVERAGAAAGGRGTFDAIAVVGGDGTVNEVINGLSDPTRMPVTQLAMGTANLIAKEFGLPLSARGLAEVVARGTSHAVDLGEVEAAGLASPRRFLMVASAGFDALVTRHIAAVRRGRLGYVGYLGPILRTVRGYRPPRIQVTLDGGERLEAGLVVLSHARCYGGLFQICDRATPGSGVLDVVAFPRADWWSLTTSAWVAWRRRISRQKHIPYRTARAIELRADEPVSIEVDGDYLAETPATVRVLPRGARLLAPPLR